MKDIGDGLEVIAGPENPEMKAMMLAEQKVGLRTAVGYDMVLIGNFDEDGRSPEEIPFYHHRTTVDEFDDERKAVLRKALQVLREVCDKVFRYPAYNIGTFYQAHSASRFIRQQILINIWPIEVHRRENNYEIADIPNNSFPYLYIYGLLVHKFAHFFDAVHGTRHDFYMNEVRIEHQMEWLELLESKGWDPAALEGTSYKVGDTPV